jgi:hypothetical protein
MIIQGVSLVGTRVIDYPPIINSNLQQYFDIGNSSSYSGSGTTLTDLSGSGRGNGAITAGVTYTSAGVNGNGSYLTFNGSSTYGQTANLYNMVASTLNVTIEVWIRTVTDNGVIISEQGTLPYDSGWHDSQLEIVSGSLKSSVWTGVGYGTTLNGGSVTRNVWQQYVYTNNISTNTLTLYINGVSKATATMTRVFGGSVLYYTIARADFTSLGDGGWLACDWSLLRVYNRALTADEVLQNYQADSWRYQ